MQLLRYNPLSRASLSSLMAHPFFDNLRALVTYIPNSGQMFDFSDSGSLRVICTILYVAYSETHQLLSSCSSC